MTYRCCGGPDTMSVRRLMSNQEQQSFIRWETRQDDLISGLQCDHDTVRKHWRVLLPEVKLMWLLHKSRSAALFPVWSLLWNRNCSNEVKRLKLWRNSSTVGKIANVVWQTHNRTTVTHLQARQAQSVPPPWQPSAIFLHNLLLHPKKNTDPVKAETPGCSNIQCLLGLTDSVSLLSEK